VPGKEPAQNLDLTPPYQPYSSNSQTGLWLAVVGVVVCLFLVAILTVCLAVGFQFASQEQKQHATATADAESRGATATVHSATAAARTQIVLPPPGWTNEIDEQFESNRNYWNVGPFENEYGKGEFTVDGGNYHGRLQATSEEGIVQWLSLSPERQFQDFYLSADCQQTDGEIKLAQYGLVFRSTTQEGAYLFSVSDAGTMSVDLWKDGEWKSILPWTYTWLVHDGKVNRLAVLAADSHYQFFINDVFAYEMEDDSLTGGAVGLAVGAVGDSEVKFQFDNFEVYVP
jgi:hypothetical protein